MYQVKFSILGGSLAPFNLRSVVGELAASGEVNALLSLGLLAAQAMAIPVGCRVIFVFSYAKFRVGKPCGIVYAVLRSRNFFGRLRLLMAKVLEPTPTYLGRLRLQAKRGSTGSIH